jgi:hypothetical protein
LPEFEKEYKRLENKYPSLSDDILKFEKLLCNYPTGIGKNFDIIHSSDKVKIIKARLACKSLKNRSIRVIYAYHGAIVTFVYLEIYFKGDKENEDRGRIAEYLRGPVEP